MDAKGFLKKLSEVHGASGNEFPVSPLVREAMEGLADKIYIDALGNVVGVKYGEGHQPRPSVMLATWTRLDLWSPKLKMVVSQVYWDRQGIPGFFLAMKWSFTAGEA